MKKNDETSLESGYYGDPTHLTYFKTSTQSYRFLLEAVRETLVQRGTLMPFIPEDVFGRHEFLGGMHAERGMSSTERMQLRASLFLAFMANEVDDGREDDVVCDGSDPLREHIDIFELFTLNNEDVDPLDHIHLKKLKSFFALAVSNRDFHVVKKGQQQGTRILMYSLREGGLSEPPPRGELVFFGQHKKPANQQDSTQK